MLKLLAERFTHVHIDTAPVILAVLVVSFNTALSILPFGPTLVGLDPQKQQFPHFLPPVLKVQLHSIQRS